MPARLGRMRHRREFLAAAKARKAVTESMILQERHRGDTSDEIRVGFTASKKVGNAVTRNRAKRRLRAVARSLLSSHGRSGCDYVLIARKDSTDVHEFTRLQSDLSRALERLRKSGPS